MNPPSPAVLGLAGVAFAVVMPRAGSPNPLRRLRHLLPAAYAVGHTGGGERRLDGRDVCGFVVGVAVAALVGMPVGLPPAVLAGWAVRRVVSRLEPASERRRRTARAGELPAVLDLLAVCLRAGLPVGRAAAVVASALPGGLAAELGRVAALYDLGAGGGAWNEVVADPVLAPVARAARRSGESGSALARDFERIAAERRKQRALDADVLTQRLALAALAPLGLCFLPAFVCLGVVPVVLSVAHRILGAVG